MWNQVKADAHGKHHNQENDTEVNDVSENFVNDIDQRRNVIIQAHETKCFLNHDENN